MIELEGWNHFLIFLIILSGLTERSKISVKALEWNTSHKELDFELELKSLWIELELNIYFCGWIDLEMIDLHFTLKWNWIDKNELAPTFLHVKPI